MKPKKAFLDTEFTDFIDCQLISLGIVTEDGQEFYAERTDYNPSACSQFTMAAVLPQLGQEPAAVVGTAEQIREALLPWLTQLGPVEIFVDYSTDWDLLLDLCGELPSTVAGKLGAFDPKAIERYWQEEGRKNHHALHDARANRAGFFDASIGERVR